MRAALYIRVSSDRQAKEGDSIPAQLDALRKYILKYSHTCVGEFVDDGISGTKYSKRDELQNLLALVKADKVDVILFTKLDRWFRSVRHYSATQAILDEHGVGWLAIWEPIYDTTTPAGRLIVNQMMSIAQFEAENTGQRIRQVQAYKVKQREVISGNVTPGYSIIDKHMVPNEDAADVRRAFEVYDRTGSLAETVRAMEGTALPISTNGMKQLLRRRWYIGEGHGLPDFCEPIVERDLFDRVQAGLSRNIKNGQKRVYLFSGIMRCGECGAVMAAQARTVRGKEILYYRCPKHYQRQVQRCSNAKTVYETVLERGLISRLPGMVAEQIEVHERESRDAVSCEKQKASLEKKIDRLKILFMNEEISLEEYRADKAALLQQIAELAPVTPPEAPESILALQGLNISEIYGRLTREEQRAFWRGVIKEIRFDAARHFSFAFV